MVSCDYRNGRAHAALPMAPWAGRPWSCRGRTWCGDAGGSWRAAAGTRACGKGGWPALDRWNGIARRGRKSRKLLSVASRARDLSRAPQGDMRRLLAGQSPPPGVLLAAALPENHARRRDASGTSWVSAGGPVLARRAYPLGARGRLADRRRPGQGPGARITAALPLSGSEVELAGLPDRTRSVLRDRTSHRGTDRTRIAPSRWANRSRSGTRRGRDPPPVVEKAGEKLGACCRRVGRRARHAGSRRWSQHTAETARTNGSPPSGRPGDWPSPPEPWTGVARSAVVGRRQRTSASRPRIRQPAGSHHPIDYTGDDAPLRVRSRRLFGLERHRVGQDTVLLNSPTPGPIRQRVTSQFSAWLWAEVRKG